MNISQSMISGVGKSDGIRDFQVASALSALASTVGVRLWREASLEGFIKTAENAKMIQALQEYSGKCLVLSGPSGTGKTRLAVILAKRLIESLAAKVLFYNTTEFLRRIFRETLEIDSAKKAKVLILDDVQPMTERERIYLLEVIDYRYRHEKALILTTNVPVNDFEKAFGMQIASRLLDSQYSVIAQFTY